MPDPATTALLIRMGQRLHLTDAGLETVLIFHHGMELPQFASFPLVATKAGRVTLSQYFAGFLDEADRLGLGFVLDTATWRASVGWGQAMGWTAEAIDQVNRDAVAFAAELRDRRGPAGKGILINGVLGPHGDAYAPVSVLSADAAEAYHRRQIEVLAQAGVDMISAMTISAPGEAIGIANAARKAGVPVVISFTLETDGHLVGGMPMAEAIERTDTATGTYPAWYGINCAHPDHFGGALGADEGRRIGMIRANASRLSHAELDRSSELDDGDPLELAQDYVSLIGRLHGLRVLGGCCGTDLRHVTAIGRSLDRLS